ncbi:hypothetical protein KGF54_004422 [Candida jiufengensis]|uniref:uncharacterized protein n=1 Tax=Candida jiufengensis TaxID=497108 RepID=UPI0022248967|nr:uncharacterized protein KGF54_004422 [Candida jiufengensis]KAI5951348.1 hypothetical protein KGF54_004422 [Candida jiufengensis]
MSDLNLGPVELHNIKTSWSKTNKQQFYKKLYPNLLDQNRSLRQIFNNNESIVQEHSNIFSDLFNFVINNIEDSQLIDEFLYQFVNENQRFSNLAVKYLESMGNALITTFKQVLNTYWTSVLELVWIKVYVFIANSILQFEEDIVSETNSMNDVEIPPLNIQRNLSSTKSSPQTSIESPKESPKESMTPKMNFDVRQGSMKTNNALLNQFNSIEIDLKSNDKYKGFRRSMDVASSPIQVQIPTSETFQKTHTTTTTNISSNLKSLLSSPMEDDEDSYNSKPSFDPRRKNKITRSSASSVNEQKQLPQIPSQKEESDYENDEFITPKPSRRGSFSENYQPPTSLFTKLQSKQQQEIAEEDSIEEIVPTFDPRRRRTTNKHEIEVPSPESSEVDEQEEETFFIQKNTQEIVPERSLQRGPITGGTFDYQSFGLKGLAPIVEDDDNSSKYESDGENKLITKKSISSAEESNSRTSSLSLHNSDYRSSISSGVDSNSMMLSKSGGGVPTPIHHLHQQQHQQQNQQQNQQQHSRQSSSGSDDFQFNVPQQQKNTHKRNNSMYSLSKSCSASVSSINSNSRASLGFMRSSFILKKEIEQQGYNHPENVSLPSTPKLHISQSTTTLNKPPKPMYMQNTMSSASIKNSLKGHHHGAYMNSSQSINRSTQSFVSAKEYNDNNTPIQQPKQQEKKGFRQRLSSIFSLKSSNSNSSTTSLQSTKSTKQSLGSSLPRTSIPYEETSSIAPSSYSYNAYNAKPPLSIKSTTTKQSTMSSPLFTTSTKPTISNCATNLSTSQKSIKKSSSSLFATDPSQNARYKYNGTSINQQHECGSVYSGDSSSSGFTIFKKTGNPKDIKFVPPPTRHTRKGNKYNVKKVPYNVFA